MPFDLTLSYPQWQGSGRSENLPRGAAMTAQVCARFAPAVPVPVSAAAGDAFGVKRWHAIFDQFRDAQAILAARQPARLLTAGGDCAVDIAPIGYLHDRYPELTVVWIDTHLDANTPATSPSGNLHGMPVSAIFGHAPPALQAMLGAPLDPTRFFYHGVRIGDEGDYAFQREQGLRTLDPHAPIGGPIHIHFDLDVLDPAEFPYLAYPEPGGLPIADAIALVGQLATGGDVVGLTITEFAPATDQDAAAGADVIAAICAAAGNDNPLGRK